MLFIGCEGSGSKRSYEKISKELIELKDYTCDVTMRVTNNRSTLEYRLKHFYKSPGRYRVEVLAPEQLKGQVTIYNGESSYIYHPGIDQYLITEDFPGSVEYNSFIGSFIDRLAKQSEIKLSSGMEGEKKLYILEFEIPQSNRYMRIERLWLDSEAAVPVKAEIYGDDGRRSVEIYYNNFVCNSGLKDEEFDIIHKIQ
jgi:outer membrane lipoprotein-sorting protein